MISEFLFDIDFYRIGSVVSFHFCQPHFTMLPTLHHVKRDTYSDACNFMILRHSYCKRKRNSSLYSGLRRYFFHSKTLPKLASELDHPRLASTPILGPLKNDANLPFDWLLKPLAHTTLFGAWHITVCRHRATLNGRPSWKVSYSGSQECGSAERGLIKR